MTSNDFVSAKEIAADAAQQIADEGFKKAGYSFYLSVIHRAVEELALDTFYKVITKDVYNWDTCGDLKFSVPANLFNIKEMYLFNSNCDAECTCECIEGNVRRCWTGYKVVHWKRTFNRFGSSGIKTARIGSGRWDGVQQRFIVEPGNVVYCGLQDGVFCFSDNATGYKNLRIVANGFASDNDTLPVIPRMARQAIVDKCKERVLYRLKHKDKTVRIDWLDAKNDLEVGSNTARNPGSWTLASRRLRALDTFEKDALYTYIAGIDNK